MTHALHRLLPTNPASWSWFPIFVDRVCAFNRQHGVSADETALKSELATKWITAPATTGFWLVLRDGGPVAHLCAWLQISFGRPSICAYQTDVDDGADTRAAGTRVLQELLAWARSLNDKASATTPREQIIQHVEFVTVRDGATYAKFLTRKGVRVQAVHSLLKIEV